VNSHDCLTEFRNEIEHTKINGVKQGAGTETTPSVRQKQNSNLKDTYDEIGMNIHDNAMPGTTQVHDVIDDPYTALDNDGYETTSAVAPETYTALTGLNPKSFYTNVAIAGETKY
jgi:hypothetical protein